MARLVLALGATALVLAGGAAAARRHVLGHSVDGRPIVAYELGDSSASRKVLVVGCVHGNEPGGVAIANRLVRLPPPPGVDLWVVPTFNPDGEAANTRGNAHRVDLNRNFPLGWRPLTGRPLLPVRALGAGEPHRLPAAASPAARDLDLVPPAPRSRRRVRRRRRSRAAVRRAGWLRAVRLTRHPGSIVTWENRALPPRHGVCRRAAGGRAERCVGDAFRARGRHACAQVADAPPPRRPCHGLLVLSAAAAVVPAVAVRIGRLRDGRRRSGRHGGCGGRLRGGGRRDGRRRWRDGCRCDRSRGDGVLAVPLVPAVPRCGRRGRPAWS